MILPGGKVDPDAIRRAMEQAGEGEDDAELRRVVFTMQRDLKSRLDKYLTSRITFMSRNVRRLRELADGDFLADATNVLAFGLPGVGKSHAMCAVGHALIDRGHAVLFMPTYSLVQELLAAKRDLELPRALRKLDQFAVLILDDVGYIQQSPEEAEILFTLLAERYERRSVFITSNLIFAQWDRIFRDQMATAAAIDRLVHHSVLLEFDVTSFRTEHAKRRGKGAPRPAELPA
jgi:DNA replication protein DnaC